MKTIFMVAVLILSFSMQIAAACELSSLQGKWERSVGDVENADSGSTRIWTINNKSLTINVQLTDSFGVYYETLTQYKIELSKSLCKLTAKRGASTKISYRNFDEPTENSSIESTSADGKLIEYSVVPSQDGSELLIRDPNQQIYTLIRSH